MNAIIFDTETTDNVDGECIEAAWLEANLLRVEEFRVTLHNPANYYHERFQPTKPIALGALATHHIIPDDLIGCRPSAEFALPDGIEYLIGHNIDFDWKVIGEPQVNRICTLALARYLFPDIDSHTQSALLYYILAPERARILCKGAHSALEDVGICAQILGYMLQYIQKHTNHIITCWADLFLLSEHARIPKKITFGKHKGMLIKDLPRDYVNWLYKQPDLDPYLRQALANRS